MAERPDDPHAINALDRLWDALLGDEAFPSSPFDSGLASTVRRVHALPDAPGPGQAFVARLEDELMSHPLVSSGPWTKTAPNSPPRLIHWRLPMLPRGILAPRSLLGRIVEIGGIAALLLLIVAGTLAGLGRLPGDTSVRLSPVPAIGLATVESATPASAFSAGTAMRWGNAGRTGEVVGPGPGDDSAFVRQVPSGDQDEYISEETTRDRRRGDLRYRAVDREEWLRDRWFVIAREAATGQERWRTELCLGSTSVESLRTDRRPRIGVCEYFRMASTAEPPVMRALLRRAAGADRCAGKHG